MSPTILRTSRRRGRRAAILLLLPLLLLCAPLSGCDHTEAFHPDGSVPVPTAGAVPRSGAPTQPAATFAGGIPIGTFAQPLAAYGDRYNGGHRNSPPEDLLGALEAIRERGGKVVLVFAGSNKNYKDADGHFSLSLWQARVDRFRGVDFSPYIDDGTVIAHYLVDEPNDPANWNNQPIPGATLEAMAQYSKEIWPDLVTVVRVEPGYLAQWNIDYQYLDAAWAQYVHRKGEVGAFISRNVQDAQGQGLGLVVGFNLLNGGPQGAPLTASQIQEWGSVLLSSSYPCAFISWQYDSTYLSGAGIGEAMDGLRSQAQDRSSKTCHGSGAAPPPDPPASTTITWPAPQDISYGTALGAAQLNAAASSGGESVPGSYSYEPAAGTLLNAGPAQTLRVTFTPSDPNGYEIGTATADIDVLPVAPTIAWTVPSSTPVGPLDPGILTASARGIGGATVPGTFAYAPAAGEVLDARPAQTLSAAFAPSDGNYTAATKSVSLAVLYPWSGFFEPVNNPGRLNTAKAGVAIPVRFSLGGNRPGPVLASGSPEVRKVSCPSWPTDAIDQTVSASSSSLRYDAPTGWYVYTWKTSTDWANSCRRLTVTLKDGTRHEARFRFSR